MNVKVQNSFFDIETPNPGAATWREDQRGDAKDHTSPPQQNAGTTTGTAGLAEVIMLGCMPVREDYEVRSTPLVF